MRWHVRRVVLRDCLGPNGLPLYVVAKLLGQSVGLLRVTSEGFGLTPDEKVLIVTMRNDRGSAVCLIPVARGGADKTNAAMQNEGDAMREALSRGEYVGNEADCRNAAISNGAVHPEFVGSEVLSFIDGAVVTHITGIGLAGE